MIEVDSPISIADLRTIDDRDAMAARLALCAM
jgi:hypothetical protein